MNSHQYQLHLEWTGNQGSGTSAYREYSRDHLIKIKGKEDIKGSSDPAFRGDSSRHNPEEFLLMALASCHMLWYLHLCADAGIIVTAYQDTPIGIMLENENGDGQFSKVTLYPKVIVKEKSMQLKSEELH